jgi:predicted O-methyltransferase YrrM
MRLSALVLLATLSCEGQSAGEADSASPAKAAPAPSKGPDASVLPDPRVAAQPGDYHFTRDMFTDRIDTWSKVLAPFVGKPDLHYLEVGVFEGRSVVWMLENVLTHPSTRVTAIDIFPEDLEQRFRANVQLTGRAESVTTLVGPSIDLLPPLPADSVDIAYIDGSHTADDVLADAVLVWRLLREGGVLVFDDFLWVGRGQKELLPVELRPSLAIAAFVTTYRNTIEVMQNDYQVVLRKVSNPCPSKHYCSPLGPHHAYLWRERKLVAVPAQEPVELQPEEIDAVETLISSRAFGEVGFRATDPVVAKLVNRLGLELPVPVNPLSDRDRAELVGVARP